MTHLKLADRWRVAWAALAGSACAAVLAQQPAPDAGYSWNPAQAEKLRALRATGDASRGAIAFEICQGCHRPRALGRPDGSYPRLAGQHDTVLIKQMTDVQAGRRSNPKMLPFADRHVLSPQDIADIAVYLRALPVPADNGRGSGENLAAAARRYGDDCVECHGPGGEGSAERFHPRLQGQHHRYLLREMIEIRDGLRRNADPRMVELVRPRSDAELDALADYLSRLPPLPAR